MSAFEKQDAMANEILTNYRGKVVAVVKATRAGATFSLLKRACELKQKTVIVAPYIKIFDKTVNEVAESFGDGNKPKVARIAKNEDICRKIQERLNEKPALRKLPFHFRPSCSHCLYNDPKECVLQKILQSDWDILGLTYAKLRALSVSESATSLDLLEKIKALDNLILDEFVTGIIVASPSVEIIKPHAYLQREFDYQRRALEAFGKGGFETAFWCLIGDFALYWEFQGKRLKMGESRYFPNPNVEDEQTFFKDNFSKCWQLIEQLTLEDKDTKMLQELLQIANSTEFFLLNKYDKISVKPVLNLDEVSSGSKYLVNFCHAFLSKKRMISLVDACLPDLDLSKSLGIKVKFFPWGDPLNTNGSQLIVCDTRKISKIDFFNERGLQDKISDFIKAASKFFVPECLLIAAQGKKIANVLRLRQKRGRIPKELMVTYYRSEYSRGTTIDPKHHVFILVGGSYLPKEAYVPETRGSGGQDEKLKAKFRKSDIKSAFINMIGRVKDPKGAKPSIVFALGLKTAEVESLVEQKDVPAPHVLDILVQPAKPEDFFLTAELFMKNPRERWGNMTEDLPVLVQIINKCRKKGKMQCGEILPKQTERVQKAAKEYSDILERYGIKIEPSKRGMSLVYLKN